MIVAVRIYWKYVTGTSALAVKLTPNPQMLLDRLGSFFLFGLLNVNIRPIHIIFDITCVIVAGVPHLCYGRRPQQP